MIVDRLEYGCVIMKKRIMAIDLFRGFSMALVINSHVFFGLQSSSSSLSSLFGDPISLWFAFFASIGQLFFFVSGCSSTISINNDMANGATANSVVIKNIRRGMLILFIGILFDPVVYFHFGHVDTLEIVGLASMVVPYIFVKCSNVKNRAKTMILIAIVIVAISPIIRLIVGYPIIDPNAEALVYYQSPSGIVEYIQAWLTTSFFPVFPYLSFFFVGAWFGSRILRSEANNDERKNNKYMLISGICSLLVGICLFIIPYLFIPDELDKPQWQQSWWVIESSFNIQPMTICSFLIYNGFIVVSLSVLYRIFDIKHSDTTNNRLGAIYTKSHVGHLFNTFVRYSYLSFTIYILQYSWIPILRIVTIITGEKMLYSIDDTLTRVGICLLANVVFAIFAKWMFNDRRRMKYTVETMVKVFSSS